MKNSKSFSAAVFVFAVGYFAACANAEPDPNFHIYIAYGQSNMAGAGEILENDRVEHPRYKMFATTACASLGRPTVGEIYPAIPPMFHCGEGLSVADWFGRHLADSLPNATIGIIPVAVGGASIKLFDPDQYASYLSTAANWLVNWAKDYGPDGNAMERILEIAQKAQEYGVIKGIIFHQGETDGGYGDWEKTVAKTYEILVEKLNLDAEKVPFLAGEMLDGGACDGMSERVGKLPQYIKNAHIVLSDGLPGQSDRLHFNNEGYKQMGKRYAESMLRYADLEPEKEIPQEPYSGTPAKIPGKIEAENYDIGNYGKAYYDSDRENEGGAYRNDGVDIVALGCDANGENCPGEYAIGYTKAGEWTKYTVNVETGKRFILTARAASGADHSGFSLFLDGKSISDTIRIPNGGDWDSYSEISIGEANIEAGIHELKILFTGDYANLDWIRFVEPEDSTIRLPSKMSLGAHTTEIFEIFSFSGKFLGRIQTEGKAEILPQIRKSVNVPGRYIAKSLRSHRFISFTVPVGSGQ